MKEYMKSQGLNLFTPRKETIDFEPYEKELGYKFPPIFKTFYELYDPSVPFADKFYKKVQFDSGNKYEELYEIADVKYAPKPICSYVRFPFLSIEGVVEWTLKDKLVLEDQLIRFKRSDFYVAVFTSGVNIDKVAFRNNYNKNTEIVADNIFEYARRFHLKDRKQRDLIPRINLKETVFYKKWGDEHWRIEGDEYTPYDIVLEGR